MIWPQPPAPFLPQFSSAQMHRAFRDQVHVILNIFFDFIEKLVQDDEPRSLDYLVGLLGLGAASQCSRQPAAQQHNRLRANALRKIILRGVQLHRRLLPFLLENQTRVYLTWLGIIHDTAAGRSEHLQRPLLGRWRKRALQFGKVLLHEAEVEGGAVLADMLRRPRSRNDDESVLPKQPSEC